ncbi:MAG: hypothetical protein J0L82_19425 [Deltaproteobacteria bacterium]|nr:hypothetical protein [Deltaproteobacteria bacterium]
MFDQISRLSRKMPFQSSIPALFSLFVFLALPAEGSEVTVKGQVYSSTHCAYASTAVGEFEVKYLNESVPREEYAVIVHFGFHDTFDGKYWKSQGQVALTATLPNTWEAKLPLTTVASRGYFAHDKMQFYFEIKNLSDGTSTYDNGVVPNDQNRRYEVELELGRTACVPGELTELAVSVK